MIRRQGLLWLCLLTFWAGASHAVNRESITILPGAHSFGTGSSADSSAGAAKATTSTTLPQPKYPDLWTRLRAGFQLSGKNHKRSIAAAREYSRARRSLREVGERAKPFLWNITTEVEKRGMPSEIALLPVVESGFRPFAYSHGRASGLWQFLPATGRRFGLNQNWWYDGRRDVLAATDAALDYLQFLHRRFGADWLLALAAYNCGEGTVSKAIRKNKRLGRRTDFWSLELPRETRDYVPRLLGLSRLVANPKAYKLTLPAIPNRPQVYAVEIPGQVDLALIANLAGLPIEEVYRLNPGYNRWATSPEGPHRVLIPAGRNIRFQAKLAAVPASDHMRRKRHTISSGDSLAKLARKYGTTQAVLRQTNNLSGSRLRRGSELLIPVATEKKSAYTLSQANRHSQSRKRRNKRNSNTATQGGKRHIVRAGDTLSEIAQRHGVSYRRIAAWNGMAPDSKLRLGQSLIVGKPSTKHAGTSTGDRQRVSYKVQQGDSLWLISRKFKVGIADLRNWNAIENKRLLRPGQSLTVYVDVRNI